MTSTSTSSPEHRHHVPIVPVLMMLTVPALVAYMWQPTAAVIAASDQQIGTAICAGVGLLLGLLLFVLAALEVRKESR